MMDLSKDALALLESARLADAAPRTARQRVRRRLIHAIAAGTVATSAAVAKATTLSVLGSANAGAAAGAGASITSGLLGALVTGLALGLVAITPASKRTEEPVEASPATVMTAASTAARPQHRPTAPALPTASTQPAAVDELPAPSTSTSTAVPRSPETSSLRSRNVAEPPDASSQPLREQQSTATSAAPALASVAVLPPSKASIARETELLAGVQRALQQGRPATALSILSRYATEFPAGELQEEAVASRVVALCDFGRREDAARWRAEFFRRYPNSALSARVRGACQSTAGEK